MNPNEYFILKNGIMMPRIGYGTFRTPKENAENAVLNAIDAGYRLLDCAARYGNEESIGEALRKSSVPRNELFITSKVWNADRGYQNTRTAFNESLKRLGLDMLDLYLVHWPANRKQFGEQARDLNAETWRAIEGLYKEGKVRAIGVCNFMPHHYEELLESATIPPMVNQIEFHAGWEQIDAATYFQQKGIVVEAWSPLGRREILDQPLLKQLSAQYGVSVAQLCIRWVVQHGLIPLPKTENYDHMKQNLKVFHFEISDEDMRIIDQMKDIGGECAVPDEVSF